jgi:hypothetical protein
VSWKTCPCCTIAGISSFQESTPSAPFVTPAARHAGRARVSPHSHGCPIQVAAIAGLERRRGRWCTSAMTARRGCAIAGAATTAVVACSWRRPAELIRRQRRSSRPCSWRRLRRPRAGYKAALAAWSPTARGDREFRRGLSASSRVGGTSSSGRWRWAALRACRASTRPSSAGTNSRCSSRRAIA